MRILASKSVDPRGCKCQISTNYDETDYSAMSANQKVSQPENKESVTPAYQGSCLVQSQPTRRSKRKISVALSDASESGEAIRYASE